MCVCGCMCVCVHTCVYNEHLTPSEAQTLMSRGCQVSGSEWSRISYPNEFHYESCSLTDWLYYSSIHQEYITSFSTRSKCIIRGKLDDAQYPITQRLPATAHRCLPTILHRKFLVCLSVCLCLSVYWSLSHWHPAQCPTKVCDSSLLWKSNYETTAAARLMLCTKQRIII